MKTKLKKCGECKNLLPPDIFVNWSSEYTTQGKYCRDCHIKMVIIKFYQELNESVSIMKSLHNKFNYEWDKVCLPCWLDSQINYEADHCIYCGNDFNYDKNGRLMINIDHMDPINLGGEDSIRNVLVVCSTCNIKKGSMHFKDWLKKIDLNNRIKAEEIYFKKHGYTPDNFIPSEPTCFPLYQGTSMIFDESIINEVINSDNLKLEREPKNTVKNRNSYEYYIDLSNKMIEDHVLFLKERFKEHFPDDLIIKKFRY